MEMDNSYNFCLIIDQIQNSSNYLVVDWNSHLVRNQEKLRALHRR